MNYMRELELGLLDRMLLDKPYIGKNLYFIKLRKYLLIISLLYYPTYQDKTFLVISHSENREFVSH